MANPIWDGIVTYAIFTAATTSSSFNLTAKTGAVTLLLPTALATSTSLAIHGLSPIDKTTWYPVNALDPNDSAVQAIAITFTPGTALYVVIPASALGLGTFRLVCADAQTATVAVLIDRI